jgi:hypothetical protein
VSVARRRPSRRVVAIAVPLTLVVLVVGLFSARFLTTENRERDVVFKLLQREAAGDAPGVLARLHGCDDAACQAKVRAFLPKVTGPGTVKIARLDSGTSYSFGDTTGTTRVVWVHGIDSRPIVQCVVVRRRGGPLTGRSVSLLRLSAPLADNEGSC